jgi:serine protease Do
MRLVHGLVLLALCAPAAARAEEPKQRDLLEAVEKQLKATAETAGPSIVCVVVSRSDRYPKPAKADDTPGRLGGFDPKEFLKNDASAGRAALAKSLDLADPRTIPDHGYAGGVVIDPSGLVLTPYHVTDGATKVYVFLPGGGGSYADIHAADSRSDLAVLKLISPPAELKAIKFAEVRTAEQNGKKATVFPGKLVLMMALPYSSNFRLDTPASSLGGITSVRYRVPNLTGSSDRTAGKDASYYKYAPLLEHDVRVNAGVSGAALLNLDGELVGLTTAAAVVYNREVGPGYAIPADDHFRRVVDVLRRGEEVEYGFLGVSDPAETIGGILIRDVMTQQPADLAGIRSGEVISRINDLPVKTYDDLLLHIGCALAGSKVTLTVVSQLGEPRKVEATLAKFRHDRPFIASARPDPVFGLSVEYGSVLSQRLSGNRTVQENGIPPGVWVREVAPKSPAVAQFKTLGDDPNRWLVTKVDGTAVKTPADFYRAAKGKTAVKLTLIDPTEAKPREHELTLP